MAIAWSTVALLVILLPGFFFFVGLTLPEKFTRETAVKNPLSQLAAVVSVSFAVHGLLLFRFGLPCSSVVPCVNLDYVLAALQLSQGSDVKLAELAGNIAEHRVAIVVYILTAGMIGTLIGGLSGSLVVSRQGFRRLAEHPWIYELSVGPRPQSSLLQRLNWSRSLRALWRAGTVFLMSGALLRPPTAIRRAWRYLRRLLLPRQISYTVAFVLTDIQHEDRRVLYRGRLLDFSLAPDGKFSYLVLLNAYRHYMLFKEGFRYPLTTEPGPPIGSTQHAEHGMRRDLSLLVVEGRNIVNAVFERYVIESSAAGKRKLKESLAAQTPARRTGIGDETQAHSQLVEGSASTEHTTPFPPESLADS